MNGITMWRPEPGILPAELVQGFQKAHLKRLGPKGLDQKVWTKEGLDQSTCTNRAKPRRSDSGQRMAKQGQSTHQGLEGLTAGVRDSADTECSGKGLPPVHLWNPPFC